MIQETLAQMSSETGRSPQERDLMRILQLTVSLMEKGEYGKAIHIMAIYEENFLKK